LGATVLVISEAKFDPSVKGRGDGLEAFGVDMGISFGKDFLARVTKSQTVTRGGTPDDLPIDSEVAVDDHVAESADLLPRDFRIKFSGSGIQMRDRSPMMTSLE
jgi:hypothetical protein